MDDTVSGAQTEEEVRKDGDQDVSPPEALDVGETKSVRRCSPRLLKYGHNNDDAVAEKQRKLEALIPCRITPLNLSSPVAPLSKKGSNVNMVQDSQANGTSESAKKVAGVRTEKRSELNIANVSSLKISEQSTPDMRRNEETENDKTSDQKKEMADTKVEAGQDILTEPENAPVPCNIKSSAADDLDEMMDIGTVDQADQEAQMKEDAMNLDSTCSPASSNRGKDQSCATPKENGRKVVQLVVKTIKPETRSAPSTPLVQVKDEPADEDYNGALTSTSSTASVKDEANGTRDLRIESVPSVAPAPEAQKLPVLYPLSGQMFCSHCKKALMKGQTAFQRRCSPALFCSTSCLTTFPPADKRPTSCQNCHKMIFRPQDIILSPAGKDTLKEFCSQSCLTSFNDKNKDATQKPSQTVEPQSPCSMCSRYCISKHDVIMNGTVHKMCSDACFKHFRTVKNITMACCASCGSYCHKKPLLLQMDGRSHILCNAECLAKYKQDAKVSQPCMLCQTSRMLEDMIDTKNDDYSVSLFCSSSCVMAHMVQTVSASGTRKNCDNCGENRVPAYHLAMSDTSVRNFCALSCVTDFQEKARNSLKQENFCTMLPIESSQSQTTIPIQSRRDSSKQPQKLNCFQCSCHITSKPEVIQIKGKLVFTCSVKCSEEFKRANSVTSLCEHCKTEKIPTEAEKINNKDCFFCSDGCKVLYRQKLAKTWGKHCKSCEYCCSMSKKLVTATYGGSTEEFCSDDCRSKYTMLFCHVAKCDTCGQKGKLKQNLPMLGDVKHFCDLTCLLQFCCDNAPTPEEILKRPSGTDQAMPVAANDVSVADPPAQNTNAADKGDKQRPALRSSRTINVQTDLKSAQPSPPSKVLKNKALLCKPLVKNKGVSCKTQMVDCEAQTENPFPQVMVVPVPVPVYVPLPMNMYTQCTPRPVGLPVPLPVPMLLPVTMDNAERIVETIQEIKEKIPSDPFEAELIFMAEMVAEDNEKNGKGQTSKIKVENEKDEASAPCDRASNYSDEPDTDDLSSLLTGWEDGPSDPSLKTPVQPDSQEKPDSLPDAAVGVSAERHSESPPPEPPSGPPSLDIEADITFESVERMSQHKGLSQESPSSPSSAFRRQQASRKAREAKTKGRMSQRLSKASEGMSKKECVQKKPAALELPKLKSQYGVEAWKHWVQWRQTQPNLDKPRYASRSMVLKEDVLQCTTTELSYGLCCFISEVKRPNGKPYSPDSLFYLCLGIQQHLFENGRVENIFMDRFYSKFSAEFTSMLRDFKPSVSASGCLHSRVEEEFLWDCKQLGAYSPIVLLNTLLFFCCKHFGFTTVKQHRQLSFSHLMRCIKTNQDYTKTTFLRFYPPSTANETESDAGVVDDVPSKRRKEEEKEEVLEMMENTENPLRCPVRLFEFYLSKCSESVKQRSNVFYLLPERCCVPNSPLWFSTTSLEDSTMEAMLIRILTVRDLHVRTSERGRRKPPDNSQNILEDDKDSE